MFPSIRVAIVDDNPTVRMSLRSMLKLEPRLIVVAEVENGSAAIAMVEMLRPEVVLMDIIMPVMNGIDATRIITSKFPDTKVIVLTMKRDQVYLDTAYQAGAFRCLSKCCSPDGLLNAIKECSSAPLKVVGHPPH
jgi:two-component system, NarL family, response regulator LiaR